MVCRSRNALEGVKHGTDGSENGVKAASNKEAGQVQKLLDIIERDPEATQAQYAVEFPGCLHPWDPDSCGEGQQHSAESAAV